jgi:NAD(P)-dependent dehydrogenase (short-subunit alcohol dehydrogenase family)
MASLLTPSSLTIVAGGSGLIGSKIVDKILSEEGKVVVLDLLQPQEEEHKKFFHEIEISPSKDFVGNTINLIEDAYGPVTGLINCISTRTSEHEKFFSDFADYDVSTWNEVIEGNLTTTFLLCQAVASKMKSRNFGSIVNFSSIYSSGLGPDLSIYPKESPAKMTTPVSYVASKGGVVALTKFLATTLGEFGIRANSVSPGGVYNNQPKEFVSAYSKRVPLGRMAQALEIAALPVFLVSEYSSYITGQNIYIDGGLSAW